MRGLLKMVILTNETWTNEIWFGHMYLYIYTVYIFMHSLAAGHLVDVNKYINNLLYMSIWLYSQ